MVRPEWRMKHLEKVCQRVPYISKFSGVFGAEFAEEGLVWRQEEAVADSITSKLRDPEWTTFENDNSDDEVEYEVPKGQEAWIRNQNETKKVTLDMGRFFDKNVLAKWGVSEKVEI